MSDGAVEVATYEEFVIANLGTGGTDRIFQRGHVAGTHLDEAAVTRVIIASGLGVPEGIGHRLQASIRLVLPVWVTVGVDVIETETWFADVLRVTENDEWLRSALAYEADRLRTSNPLFAHYIATYYEGSSATIRRALTKDIQAAASIRANLESAYPRD